METCNVLLLDDAACLDPECSKATEDNLSLTLSFFFLTGVLIGNNNDSENPVDQPRKGGGSVLESTYRTGWMSVKKHK